MKKLLYLSTAILLAAPQFTQAKVPDSNEIYFKIYRNGSDFGFHSLNFSETPDGRTQIDIEIKMKAGLGPITFFRYEHTNTETWKGDNPQSVMSQTYDDGNRYNVDAQWGPQNVSVTVNEESYETPAAVTYPTSYWNRVFLDVKNAQLLNTQKGQIEDIKSIENLGVVEYETQNGPVQADHYRITADFPINVWYDQNSNEWIGLEFKVRGSDIRYERLYDREGTSN